jgi:hypothetical protein
MVDTYVYVEDEMGSDVLAGGLNEVILKGMSVC